MECMGALDRTPDAMSHSSPCGSNPTPLHSSALDGGVWAARSLNSESRIPLGPPHERCTPLQALGYPRDVVGGIQTLDAILAHINNKMTCILHTPPSRGPKPIFGRGNSQGSLSYPWCTPLSADWHPTTLMSGNPCNMCNHGPASFLQFRCINLGSSSTRSLFSFRHCSW